MARRLKKLFQENKVTRVFGMGQFCDPKIVEMVGMTGAWDAVWFDQEHVGLSNDQIEQCSRAARSVGLDCFVRLAPTDYAAVMRPLEAGALGIMAAQIRSVDQAAEVIRWSRFYPEGLRGINSAGVDGGYGSMPMADYLKRANDETYVILQIEHKDAVECVEKIAALKHLNALFIGPADLSQSMGIPGQTDHPDMWRAIERVAKACAAHGIPWAILPSNPDYAKRCVELGCRMLSIGFDVWILHRGLKSFQTDYDWLPHD